MAGGIGEAAGLVRKRIDCGDQCSVTATPRLSERCVSQLFHKVSPQLHRGGAVGLLGQFIASYGGEASKPASLDELLRRLDRGDFDLVGVGRALLQDPQWAVKVHQGRTDELMDFERSAMMSLS